MKTLRYLPVIIAILLAGCNKYDIQPEQAEGFIKFYTSNLTETALDVKETSDGGYVAVGSSTDENGMRDIYIIRTDKFGNEASWSPVMVGGDNDDVGTSIQVVSDGYVILGYSKQSDTTDYEMYLFKLDANGSVVWETRRGFLGDVVTSNLVVTSDNQLIACAVRENQQYLLARFDANGVYDKPRTVTPANPISGACVIEAGNFYVVCGTEMVSGNSRINLFPIDSESFGLPAGGGYIPIPGVTGSGIQELDNGDLLITGIIRNTGTGFDEIFLHKIRLDYVEGDIETVAGWEEHRSFNEPGDLVDLRANAVRIVNGNRYAIVGTRTETGNDDIILLFTDANGTEVSRTEFGDDGFQQGISLELTEADGGLIIVGNNGVEDNSMMALIKTDAEGKL